LPGRILKIPIVEKINSEKRGAKMDAIAIARQLGKAIQEDYRFKTLEAATKMNDECQPLQNDIERFGALRDKINQEISKPDKDSAGVAKMDEEMRELYDKIMATPEMMAYSMAKGEMEAFMEFINQIVSKSAAGEDPEQIEMEDSCAGNCSSCAGCH
jgi:cell fate (sporulation/competence/biofilm development) regulator YlbF (YheA/YmcA/DUF963 family)